MPVLNTGTPPFILVDDQTYIAALNYYGQWWLIPSAVVFESYTFDTSTLVATGRLADPGMTPEDLVASLIPGNFLNPAVLTPKMRQLVERYLYDQYVSATGVEPPPAVTPPVTPPITYVAPPAPITGKSLPNVYDLVLDIQNTVNFLRYELQPRDYVFGANIAATGIGSAAVPFQTGGTATQAASGFWIDVGTFPPTTSRSSGTPAIYYDLGDFSWGSQGRWSHPIKIMRLDQIYWPSGAHIDTVAWNLALGVHLNFRPLYGTQPMNPPLG